MILASPVEDFEPIQQLDKALMEHESVYRPSWLQCLPGPTWLDCVGHHAGKGVGVLVNLRVHEVRTGLWGVIVQ